MKRFQAADISYFYPRSPYGERRYQQPCGRPTTGISIHALLTESDLYDTSSLMQCQAFLSTLSLRRATYAGDCATAQTAHFYPRSPYGERPWARGSRVTYVEISIHALLTESDFARSCARFSRCLFLSTLSLRRATLHLVVFGSDCRFLSTLSLRRATFGGTCQAWRGTHFYPRSPYGERHS